MRRRRGPGAAFPRRRGCGRRWRIQMVACGVAPKRSFTGYNATMSGTSVALLFKTGQCALLLGMLLPPHALRAQLRSVEQRPANGVLEGVGRAGGKVRPFKGTPYAAAPVGPLRWKAPEAAGALDRGPPSHRLW